jgi:hypothetical protein
MATRNPKGTEANNEPTRTGANGEGGDPSRDAGDPSSTGAHPAVQTAPVVGRAVDVDGPAGTQITVPEGVDTQERSNAPDARSAFVMPQRYADPGEGWEVGKRAPSDQYKAVDPSNGQPTGKAQSEPVDGYGVQLAVKGDTVTQAMLDAIKSD